MHTEEGMADGQTQKGEASRRGNWRLRREFICCFLKPRLVGPLLRARQSTRHWGDAVIRSCLCGVECLLGETVTNQISTTINEYLQTVGRMREHEESLSQGTWLLWGMEKDWGQESVI